MKLEMRCLKFQKLLTAVLCLMLLTIFSPAYAAEVSASALPVSMISVGDGTITITLNNTNENPRRQNRLRKHPQPWLPQ